jgi:hypothetical protein
MSNGPRLSSKGIHPLLDYIGPGFDIYYFCPNISRGIFPHYGEQVVTVTSEAGEPSLVQCFG